MQVLFGNPAPTATDNAPVVTVCGPLPDDADGYTPHEDASVLANAVLRHMATSGGGITRMSDVSGGTGHQEAVLTCLAGWRSEGNGNPSWVASDNPDFAVLLGHIFGCPVGIPDDVEDTHFTFSGPPGVGPTVAEVSP